MKKSIAINLAGTIFSVDEDAYVRLQKYLDGVKRTFEHGEDGSEIIADIEHRIAEQFIERDTQGERIVTLDDVNAVIAVMGEPERIADESQAAGAYSHESDDSQHSTTQTGAPKRLFRDEENGLIAGVCAGIAAYFGIDVVFVRILFLILLFINGIGALIYIAAWIAMPAAKTLSDKMQMRGEPVTIESLKEKVEHLSTEKAANTVSSAIDTGSRSISQAVSRFGSKVGSAMHTAGPRIRKLIGGMIALASFVAIVVATYIFIAIAAGFFGVNELREVLVDVPQSQQTAAFIAFIFIVLLPLFSIFFGAIALTQNRHRILPQWIGFLSLGAWIVAVGVFGTIMLNHAEQIDRRVDAITTEAIDAERNIEMVSDTIRGIVVGGSHTVRILPSEDGSNSITIHGSERSLDKVSVTEQSGIFTIERVNDFEVCFFFCWTPRVDIEVRTANAAAMETLDASGAARIVMITPENVTINSLEAELSGASRLLLPNSTINTLTLHASGASQLLASGTVTTLLADISGSSRLRAANMNVHDGAIDTSGASGAWIGSPTTNLTATLSGASKLFHGGDITVRSAGEATQVEKLTPVELKKADAVRDFNPECTNAPFAETCDGIALEIGPLPRIINPETETQNTESATNTNPTSNTSALEVEGESTPSSLNDAQ